MRLRVLEGPLQKVEALPVNVIFHKNVLEHPAHIALDSSNIRSARVPWPLNFVVCVVPEILLVAVLLVTKVAIGEIRVVPIIGTL